MRAFLTGGTGFIGSHAAVALLEAGHEVALYDNLCNSSASVVTAIQAITGKAPIFTKGDVRDAARLSTALDAFEPDVVMHFAGLKAVGESVRKPLEYYDNNVGGALSLLKAMQKTRLKRLIFSSSATVYGPECTPPCREDMPIGHASSPYGETKIQVESILEDLCRSDPEWSIVSLRYFNPIGAHESGLIGEDPCGIPSNLVPCIAQVALGKRPVLTVFGDDYPTPDGTAIRDYIHVQDLAEGHVKAGEYCLGHRGMTAINLGSGRGSSVLEVIHAYERACGRSIPCQVLKRRAGDLAVAYACADRARELLHWSAKRSLEQMCADSWKFAAKASSPY